MIVSPEVSKSLINKKLFVVTIIAILFSALYNILRKSLLISTGHVDGVYQTYNSLHRLYIDHVIGLDFYPYIGIGPTYFLYPSFSLSGGTVFSSQLSALLITNIAVFLTVFTLLRFSPLWSRGKLITIIVTIFIYAMLFSKITPGHSLVPLRAFVVIIALWSSYYFLFKTARPVLYGLSMGVVAVWSNDYGIPTFISMLLVGIIYNANKGQWKNTFVFVTSAVIFTVLLLHLVTHGNITEYFRLSREVATDQFWYFGPYDLKGNIYSFSDLLFYWWHPDYPVKSIAILTAPVLLLLIIIDAVKNSHINSYILFIAGAASVGGGLLPEVAGHKSQHYYYMLYAVYPFLVVAVYHRYICFSYPGKNVITDIVHYTDDVVTNKANTLLIIILIYCAIGVPLITQKVLEIVDQSVYVDSLGGYILKDDYDLISVSENIKELSLPPDRVLFQEYAGIPGIITGSENTPYADSVIHALGKDTRGLYYGNLVTGGYEFITTTNPEYSAYQNWSLFQNWAFYRYVVTNYIPAYTTTQLIFWSKHDDAKQVSYSDNAVCHIQQLSESEVLLTVNRSDVDQSLYEVYVDMALDFKEGIIPVIGKNRMIRVESNTMTDTFQNTMTLPYYSSEAYIPVMFGDDKSVSFRFYSDPSSRSSIKINSCKTNYISSDMRILSSIYKIDN